MFKRGQITTFLIIGIIILAVVGMVLYFRQAEVERVPKEAVAEEAQPIQLFVDECIQKTAVPLIYYLGEQGGYIFPPQNSFSTEKYAISYGFYRNQNTLPTVEEMQVQLSESLKELLPLCTDSFKNFKGVEVTEGNISIETRIFQDEVLFLVDYPLSILKQEKKYQMQNFVARVPVRLGRDLSIASTIISEQQNGFTLNKLIFPDFKVSLMPVGAGALVFGLMDEKTVLNNRTFLFMFAYELPTNKNPEIETLYNPVFETGKLVYLQINATDQDGDVLTYSTNSTEFPINPNTGAISAIAPAAGDYPVAIRAEDGNGGIDEKAIIFRVV